MRCFDEHHVGGVTWFGPHAAHGTCFVPVFAGCEAAPSALNVGNASTIDRGSAWWAHRFAHNLAQLKDVGSLCFRDLVYAKLKNVAKDAVLSLVDKERDGEQVDRALIKNALGIFVEMGMGGMEAYETDFEAFLLTDTAKHYKRKASLWIEEDSCPAYLIKAEQCLGREKERVGHYLHASSETKILKECEKEVLAQYETQLLEKEHSGAAVLLAAARGGAASAGEHERRRAVERGAVRVGVLLQQALGRVAVPLI